MQIRCCNHIIQQLRLSLIITLLCVVTGTAFAQFTGGAGRGDNMALLENVRFGNYWTGAVDSTWDTSGNWYEGTVPTATLRAIIPPQTNNPIINNNENKTVLFLRIEANAKLTIKENANFNVDSTIENFGGPSGLVIKSSTLGTGTLMHHTDTTTATVQRYIHGDSTWCFLSSPVINQQVHDTEWTPAGTYGDNTSYDLYIWDEPTSCWIYNLNDNITPSWTSIHPGGNFLSGRGYLYALQELNSTKEFKGQLGNGEITIPLTVDGAAENNNQGFNLSGNPYPSSIDWKNNAGFTRDILVDNGGGYDIWIWNSTAGNYGVYNSASSSDDGTNDVTRYIAPMQGFFVQAATTGDFTFNNLARTSTGASNWLKSASLFNSEEIRISVNSRRGNYSDEVKCNFDSHRDIPGIKKLFTPIKNAPSLFLASDKVNYSTRHLADSIGQRSIPISFTTGAADTFTLNYNSSEYGVKSVILEDNITNNKIELPSTGSYTFAANPKERSDRFILHINTPLETVIANSKIRVVTSQGILTVKSGTVETYYLVELFDTMGKTLIKERTNSRTYTCQLPQKGIYIVAVTIDNERKSYKIINN